jgi:soluble lytic murein transglycosylase-like protein
MSTVIDTLIVTLGLDPRDFTKGEKEVAASILKTKNTVNAANNDMAAGFSKLASKFLGWTAVLVFLKKLISAASDLSTETRQLGIDSKNYGLAANQLRNFQNAAEMMGGKAEDVTASVMGLQKAMYDLTVMGQTSPQLEMLTRLGVQIQDNTGHARNFRDVALDTADALERAQKNGTLNRTEAYFAAKQSGFDEGTAQLILSGRKNAEAELSRQEQRRQVQEHDVAAATEIERTKANVAQGVQAQGIGAVTAGVDATHSAAALYDRAVTKTTDAMEGLAHAVDSVVKKFHELTPPTGQAAYAGAVAAAAKKYGIEPGTLMGLVKQESNFNPGARSKAGAVGIMQLMPKYFPGAGKDPMADIDTGAGYLRKLHDDFVKSGDADDDGAWFLALESYNAGQSRVRGSMKPNGKPLAKETLDYPGKVMSAAARMSPLAAAQAAVPTPSINRAGGSTTVNVGPVTVQTAATDANGIAKDMTGAVRRKMLAAQAEPGQH